MAHTPFVPPAELGPISDNILEQAIAAAASVEAAMADDGAGLDRLDPNAAQLFLLVARPGLEELLQYRRRMNVIRGLATEANVVLMPGR